MPGVKKFRLSKRKATTNLLKVHIPLCLVQSHVVKPKLIRAVELGPQSQARLTAHGGQSHLIQQQEHLHDVDKVISVLHDLDAPVCVGNGDNKFHALKQ